MRARVIRHVQGRRPWCPVHSQQGHWERAGRPLFCALSTHAQQAGRSQPRQRHRSLSTSHVPEDAYLRYIHRAKAPQQQGSAAVAGAGSPEHTPDAGNESESRRTNADSNAADDDAEDDTPAVDTANHKLMMVLKELKAGEVLRKKALLRQQLEVPGNCTVNEAITIMVNQRVASFLVVNRTREVIGLFTARDVLKELAKYPNKLDGLAAQAHEFMKPLTQMVFCSPEDSLYQCLLVMTELRIRNLPVVVDNQVAGIINVNDITDFTFSAEELGGKKTYITNISERKGLKQGLHISASRAAGGTPESPNSEYAHSQHIFASVGSWALPHPFKRVGHVSPSARDHRDRELATDVSLSEDAHFVLSVTWPTPSKADALHYIGIADGVGSWRGVGVDPREFPQRLMHWAQQYIISAAPRPGDDEPRTPPKPHQVLSAAWEMTMSEKVIGSSTACIATLDYELDQLTFSNIGDNGVVILRHIDSDVAGYMREKHTPRHMRNSALFACAADTDLRIAFISQQQLRSFNLPYQLGRTNVPSGGGLFETPRDAVNTSFPVMPGDIVVIATDGLYDNMELDELCEIAQAWELKWFGGTMQGLEKQDNAASEDLAQQLAVRARELSLDTTKDSPFALLAKENDVNWTNGGMPDDITVVAMRIVSKAVEVLAEDEDDIELANRRLPMSFTTQAQAVQGSC